MRGSDVIKAELDEQIALKAAALERVAYYQAQVSYHNAQRDKCANKSTRSKRSECTSTQQGNVNVSAGYQAAWQEKVNTANNLITTLQKEYQDALASETITAGDVSRELARQGETVDSVFNKTVEQGVTDRFESDLDKEARQQALLMQADADSSKKKVIGYSIMVVALAIAIVGIVYIVKKSKKQD